MLTQTDTPPSFPLPAVQAALQPYIKTRQETQAIRNGLQASFPVSAATAMLPSSLEHLPAPRVGNLRKTYWRALQEHHRAQQQYDTLHAELDQLRQTSTSHASTTAVADDPAPLVDTYLPVLRQRETHRQLTILSQTLAKIDSLGSQTLVGEPFDIVAKHDLGDAPIPPATALTGPSRDRDNAAFESEYHTARLKQEMLDLQDSIARHDAAHLDIDLARLPAQAHLVALQAVHAELTAWMERQLALLSDLDTSTLSQPSTPTTTVPLSSSSSHASIPALYESYLSTRQHFLYTLAHTSSSPRTTPSPPPATPSSGPSVPLPTPSELLLPHLAPLQSQANLTQTLHHSTAHLRHTVAHHTSQRAALLNRLAAESHLVVPAPALAGTDWLVAAEGSSEATREVAMRCLRSAQEKNIQALTLLEDLLRLPERFEGLVGGGEGTV